MKAADGMPADVLVLSSFAEVREALTNEDLSRSIDRDRYEAGNILEGILMMLDGDDHRRRRRAESGVFTQSVLAGREIAYVRRTERILSTVPTGPQDLLELSGCLSLHLTAEGAGVDVSHYQVGEIYELLGHLRVLAKGVGIDAATEDEAAVRRRVSESLSVVRRDVLEPTIRDGATAFPGPSILGVLLERQQELAIDADQVVREVAVFLEAGADTTSQTVAATFHEVFSLPNVTTAMERLSQDLGAAQRFVHEALRLRPTLPIIKRRAIRTTNVAGHRVPAGGRIDLDIVSANQDPTAFGATAEVFDPDRRLPPSIPRYGHSMGGGVHACIGRILAVGQPLRATSVSHQLFGLAPHIVQTLASRGIRPDPHSTPVADSTTTRWTHWARFPVVFGAAGAYRVTAPRASRSARGTE